MKKIHKLAEIIPEMSQQEYANLVQDIQQNGLIEPIVLYQEKILDGRTRYKACIELGVKPRFRLYEGNDPACYVLSMNVARRHLTAIQRAVIADEASKSSQKGRPKKQEQAPIFSTIEEASKQVGISSRVVRQVRRVRESGSTELLDAVVSEKIQIKDADKVLRDGETHKYIKAGLQKMDVPSTKRNREKPSSLSVAIQQVKAEEAEARVATGEIIPNVSLFNVDIRELHKKVKPNSVDFIFTDPPYDKEGIECYKHLADFAVHALKENGSLMTIVGKLYLPEIIDYMKKQGLNYHWAICFEAKNPRTQVHKANVHSCWKAILWYVKGGMPYERAQYKRDVVISPKKTTRVNHKWKQSLEGWIEWMRPFVQAGDVICDAFCGAGTCAVASQYLKCSFIGADIDPDCIKMTRVALAEGYHPKRSFVRYVEYNPDMYPEDKALEAYDKWLSEHEEEWIESMLVNM